MFYIFSEKKDFFRNQNKIINLKKLIFYTYYINMFKKSISSQLIVSKLCLNFKIFILGFNLSFCFLYLQFF